MSIEYHLQIYKDQNNELKSISKLDLREANFTELSVLKADIEINLEKINQSLREIKEKSSKNL
ncbi:MAG: hypothetical protein LAT82_01930 [Nanoarchaeota archaeon]|nr:hypothetical protein [Nanoarchaeota archaeon]